MSGKIRTRGEGSNPSGPVDFRRFEGSKKAEGSTNEVSGKIRTRGEGSNPSGPVDFRRFEGSKKAEGSTNEVSGKIRTRGEGSNPSGPEKYKPLKTLLLSKEPLILTRGIL